MSNSSRTKPEAAKRAQFKRMTILRHNLLLVAAGRLWEGGGVNHPVPEVQTSAKRGRQGRPTGISLRCERTPMKTLGEFIREKREAAGLSLRELARRVEITAPFLSDIELGRRAPAEKNLALIAKELGIPLGEIQQYDHRETVSDFKAIIESNPALAGVFRTQLKQLKAGSITAEELAKKLNPK